VGIRTLAEAYERLLQFKGCPHYCGGSCDVTITAAAVMSFLLSPAGLSRTMVLGLKYSLAKKVGFRPPCSLYGMEKAHRASMLEDFVAARYEFMVQVQKIVRYVWSMLSIA
jgi:hypothetical protein